MPAMSHTRTPDPRQVHQRGTSAEPGYLGLTPSEIERGSIDNYVVAVIADNKTELSYFRELSEQTERVTQTMRRGPGTYLVPRDVLAYRNLAKAGEGGYLVDAGIKGYAHAMDAASVLSKLPVTRLPNMVGDAKLTRESVKGTAAWLGDETTVIGDVQSTFGQIALAAKSVAGSVIVSNQLMKQAGPAGNAFVTRAGAVTMAEAIDRALVAGSGASGQPLGLLGITGIDSRAGTSFALSDAAAMLRVSEGYATDDSIMWLCGVAAAEDLRTRVKTATYGNGFLLNDDGRMLGKPVIVSRSVGDQVLICMPWSQCWAASWAALEIGVDPFTHFRDGRSIVRFVQTVDFCVERAASVAVATALT
jgi:HK97 family phage major capsid protein